MNEQKKKVSIIIPAYNTEKYIYSCVQSILNQTYSNIEIILVDDGSKDNTLAVCNEIAMADSRVQVIHQANKGVSMARQTGLDAAQGEFTMFIDSDDKIDKDMISVMLKQMAAQNADVVECRFIKEFPTGVTEVSTDFGEVKLVEGIKAIELMNYGKIFQASMCDKIFKRALIKDNFFKEGVTIGEDYRFVFEIFKNSKKVLFIPNIFYHYIQREDSASYTGYTGNGYDIINNYTEVKDEICHDYPELETSAVAFWGLQEMAVIISMIKADWYDDQVIKRVHEDIRDSWLFYMRIKEVPVYLKVCCLLLRIHPKLLIMVYKTFFKSRYQLSKK